MSWVRIFCVCVCVCVCKWAPVCSCEIKLATCLRACERFREDLRGNVEDDIHKSKVV
jgi:hypothetical protein